MSPGLKRIWPRSRAFDYPNYEIYFALASSLDPALKVIEQVKATSQHPVHIVIAGPPEDCSEKVFNLRRSGGIACLKRSTCLCSRIPTCASREVGCEKIIAPLEDARIGATTGYRWIIPSGAMGAGGFASALASAWNASVATLLGRAGENFCWGGGTAIRRANFDDAHVLEVWNGAASDDFAMTQALEHCPKADRLLPGVPGANAASLDRQEPAGIHEPADADHARLFVEALGHGRRWRTGVTAFTLLYALRGDFHQDASAATLGWSWR